jgi:branched-chain amino acid transport system permease protein
MNNSRRFIGGSFGALVLLLLVFPVLVSNEYYLHVLIMTYLGILIASSLRLVMTIGLVSFAHAAFVAIGGYTSALAVMRLDLNYWVALQLAVVTAMVIAASFGVVLLRLKGTYFLIASFALGEIVLLIFTRFTNPFGGAAGLVDIPPPASIVFPGLFSITFTLGSKVSFYYLALALVLLLLSLAYRLDKGRLGAIWNSIRMADQLAESLGVNAMLYKVTAFTIGCAMAAVAGTFQAHYYSHINPSGFNIFVLVNYMIYAVVGGTKRFYGPIIGAVFMTFLAEFLSFSQKLADTQVIIYGVILILVIIFLPEGIVSLPGKLSPGNRRSRLASGSSELSRGREERH